MSTFGQRMVERMNDLGIDFNQLSERSGVGYSTLKEAARVHAKSSRYAWAIAAALHVNERWLATGKGEKDRDARTSDQDWSDVRGYPQAVGLGNGIEAEDYAEAYKLKFRSNSLARKNLRADNLAVFYGKGDSMLPRVHHGDAILFDTSDKTPRDSALYVIQIHGAANPELQVKRAMILDDVVYFAADNPDGDHAWGKPRRMDSKRGWIDIIGRVRWIGSWED